MATTTGLDKATLNELAREGARIRLLELHAHGERILRVFPELKEAINGAAVMFATPAEAPAEMRAHDTAPAAPVRKARTTFTAAQRRSISRRMKAYWAERRARQGT